MINSFENWGGSNFFLYKKIILTGPLTLKSMIVTFTSSLFPLVLFISYNTKVHIYLFIKFRYIEFRRQ